MQCNFRVSYNVCRQPHASKLKNGNTSYAGGGDILPCVHKGNFLWAAHSAEIAFVLVFRANYPDVVEPLFMLWDVLEYWGGAKSSVGRRIIHPTYLYELRNIVYILDGRDDLLSMFIFSLSLQRDSSGCVLVSNLALTDNRSGLVIRSHVLLKWRV